MTRTFFGDGFVLMEAESAKNHSSCLRPERRFRPGSCVNAFFFPVHTIFRSQLRREEHEAPPNIGFPVRTAPFP